MPFRYWLVINNEDYYLEVINYDYLIGSGCLLFIEIESPRKVKSPYGGSQYILLEQPTQI
jgi:hypothetical protein